MATTLDRGKKSRKLRDELQIRTERRPHADDARLSRRDGSRWIDLREQFLSLCDGLHTVTSIAKHMSCSFVTAKRIKAELLQMGLIEEHIVTERRGRPRLLSLTEQGKRAHAHSLMEFRSVMHAYSPTVAEMEAIRRSRREAIRDHIKSKPLEEIQSAQRSLDTSIEKGSYVNPNHETNPFLARRAS